MTRKNTAAALLTNLIEARKNLVAAYENATATMRDSIMREGFEDRIDAAQSAIADAERAVRAARKAYEDAIR